MYAVIETGGKQYRVQPGQTIEVERLPDEPGRLIELDQVLLVAGDGGDTRVGAPTVPGAVVTAEILDHVRGDKIIVFRFKSKVRYRRKTGHRQSLTRLRIADIQLGGDRTEQAAAPARQRPASQSTPPTAEGESAPAAEGGSAPAAEAASTPAAESGAASAGEAAGQQTASEEA